MRRSVKKNEIDLFVDYLSRGKDLTISTATKKMLKQEVDIKQIVKGFITYDKNTSKKPYREGISLSNRAKKLAEDLKIDESTLIDEIISEKYEVFLKNKKILREKEGVMLSDLEKFNLNKVRKKIEYESASTSGRQQITLKEGLNISRNSKLGKKLRKYGIPYQGYEKDKIAFGYNKDLTNKLYEDIRISYAKKGEKPPSPNPIKEAIYDVYYNGVNTGIKIQITEIEQLFSNTKKRAYEIL